MSQQPRRAFFRSVGRPATTALAQFAQLVSVGLPYLAIAVSENQTSTEHFHLLLAIQISGYAVNGALENLAWRSTPGVEVTTSTSAIAVLASTGVVGLLLLAPRQGSPQTMLFAILCCVALPLVRHRALRAFSTSVGAYLRFSIKDVCFRGFAFLPYLVVLDDQSDAELFFFCLYFCGLTLVIISDSVRSTSHRSRGQSYEGTHESCFRDFVGSDASKCSKREIALAASFSLIVVVLTRPFLRAVSVQVAHLDETTRLLALLIFRAVSVIPFVLKPIVLTRSRYSKPIFPGISWLLVLLSLTFALSGISKNQLSGVESAALNGVASGVIVLAVLQLMNVKMSFSLVALLAPIALIASVGDIGIAASLGLVAVIIRTRIMRDWLTVAK